MAKTEPIVINVYRDCGTCEHVCFFENSNVSKCSLSNEIVSKNTKLGIEYKECDKWDFNKELLDDLEHFIDKETSKILFSEIKSLKNQKITGAGMSIEAAYKAKQINIEKG